MEKRGVPEILQRNEDRHMGKSVETYGRENPAEKGQGVMMDPVQRWSIYNKIT